MTNKAVQVELAEAPPEPICLAFDGTWKQEDADGHGSAFTLRQAGTYRFTNVTETKRVEKPDPRKSHP